MTPQPGLPDLVFTANAGLVFHATFLSSRFRHEVRAKESPHFDAWFAEHGFTVEHLPEDMYHEGAGDALFCGETLFAGYRTRSDASAHQWVGEQFGVRVLPLELVNPRFYHLDTCFCPLAPGEAIYFPDAFDAYGQRVLQTHVPKLIPVAEAEAYRFGCNAVVVGKTVVHNSRCPELAASLATRGLPADRGGAGRVPEGRRQREVPDAAARRRRSGGVEIVGPRGQALRSTTHQRLRRARNPNTVRLISPNAASDIGSGTGWSATSPIFTRMLSLTVCPLPVADRVIR